MDTIQTDVLTINESATHMDIPRSTLYTLVREGTIPSQKVGRHWRFRKTAIDRWLEEARTEIPEKGGEECFNAWKSC